MSGKFKRERLERRICKKVWKQLRRDEPIYGISPIAEVAGSLHQISIVAQQAAESLRRSSLPLSIFNQASSPNYASARIADQQFRSRLR